MITILERMAIAFSKSQTVAIKDCVHFCAYRYGRNEINPYEAFARGLVNSHPINAVHQEFSNYLRFYRPADLGEALGVKLSRSYPLWYLPWRSPSQVVTTSGWQNNPSDIVDVMTHFSPVGIPCSGLKQEFRWHKNAFEAMRDVGYRPSSYGYITVRKLRKGDQTRYLVTDGNHRLSALSALNHEFVLVKIPSGTTIRAELVSRWPLVRTGMVTKDDALKIFNAYLNGNQTPICSSIPAAIIK